MKKILPLLIIGILVFCGLGASSIIIEKDNILNNIYDPAERGTHTVLGEFGTRTWLDPCQYAHSALKQLYAEGQLDFYYVTLVHDKNYKAYLRLKEDLNNSGSLAIWWDGGYIVNRGANSNVQFLKTKYTDSINDCGTRPVENVDINLDVTWLGETKIKVLCRVINNEPNTYGGTIRVYILEKKSSMGWSDFNGNRYTMAFLDWAFNEPISISSGGSWSSFMIWNGKFNGYPSVTKSNTFVIAAVFNDEWHQGYSKPPSDSPFDAYYVDEVVGVDVEKFKINQEIPKNIAINKQLIELLQIHNNLFPIIRQLLGL